MAFQTARTVAPGAIPPGPAADDTSTELPIRLTYLHEERLGRLGAELARGNIPDLTGLRAFDFHRRHADNAKTILSVYRSTSSAQANGEPITPAAQWLLDNHFLVEETVRQISRDLPKRFYRELPLTDLPSGGRVPRALLIAWAYVAHTDSTVTQQMLAALTEGYQSVAPLKIGELWALPSLLRFVLVENLRRIAVRVERSRRLRRYANEAADLLAAQQEPGRGVLDRFADHARDPSFATQLLHRLRDGSRSAGDALQWLERELERHGTDAEEVTVAEHRTLASGNVTMGNIVRGLRRINDTDWTEWFESVSRIDQLLRSSSDYAALDFQSRDQYRSAIEELARRSTSSEHAVAEEAIAISARAVDTDPAHSDIGFFLVGNRRSELERAIGYRPPLRLRTMRAYRRLGWLGLAVPVLALTAATMLLASVAFAGAGISPGAAILLLALICLPAMEGAFGLFGTLILAFTQPTRLVGYEFRDGVPDEARTLVVVPTLIASRADVEEMVHRLEVHHLGNQGGELYYALLSDWADSHAEHDDTDLELLSFARARIAALNGTYPASPVARFHLLHRRRLYNEAEGMWMGWERKRGKLHELNLLLRGEPDTTFLPPDTALPDKVVHVLTLDADTRMTRDAAVKLAGKLCHPMNRPHVDTATRRVTGGYGILQPRITPSLTTGDEESFFQRVFSANRGLDPYVFAVSDLYQDVFGEGTFTGKGIYHVDAMEAALKERIPENAVLSHDLLEGAFARAALVTDIEVVEDYPTRYPVDASRHHRWARGDWQLLPFLFDPKSSVPPLSRWKMFDNLRRTLTPILWIAAAVAGCALLPSANAAQWLLLLVVLIFVAPTFDIINAIASKSSQTTTRGYFAAFVRDFAYGSAQVALRIAFLGHTAWLMGDAIVRTLHRLFISRRRLLEWRTATQVHRSLSADVGSYYRLMWGSVVIAALTVAIPVAAGSSAAWLAGIFAFFWVMGPGFAWLVSRPEETEERLDIEPADRDHLRRTARRTWLYFETFVTAEHHMLPPDNFQETPAPVVAPRTSPTNIGMYFLSILAARDFGWIGLVATIDRIEQTLATVERMEKFRGHLFNWYDTKRLVPLDPRYVSAVDSGNLAGHLLTMSGALSDWSQAPSAHMQGDFDGILDTVGVLEEALAALPDDRRQLRPLRSRLEERITGMRRAVASIRSEPETAAIRTLNLAVLAGEIANLAGALDKEIGSGASTEVASWAHRVRSCCEAHIADAHFNPDDLDRLKARLRDIARRARTLAFQMDFALLYREDRKLLSIGYRVAEHQLDESCYDLLASEARLTSLFAIAKGDLPTEHWFRLGRPVVEIGFRGALLSWAGSMFEYLMPPLVMKEPDGGILNQTSRLVIRRQIAYGRERNVPWGISEAAYNARDPEMTYQYTNFGVPGLGLKRGLAHNLVVAPYATVLASQFYPRQAVENLKRLAAIGGLGRYGYYDAIDFTAARLPEGATRAVVRNYMAHHQGMSIVAVANAVYEGRMRDRFHIDPVIEAAELLLQEKAPREIPATTIRSEAPERPKSDEVVTAPDMRRIVDPLHAAKATNILSNGRYSIMLSSVGAGYSRLGELAVTRWHADPVEDRHGTFIFVRDLDTGDWWSATAEPRQAPGEVCEAVFHDDKATFFKTAADLRVEVECVVASEADGECRRVTIFNESSRERLVDVTSYAEAVLAPEASDAAHPAFSKMFVRTEIDRQRGAIFAERRKRAASDKEAALVHFVTGGAFAGAELEAETDRRAFIGRGRDLGRAAAFDPGHQLTFSDGYVLDPVLSLRRKVRIPPNKMVRLTFWTLAGSDRSQLEEAMARLDHAESFARQAMHAWTRSQVQTRHVGLSLAEAATVQKLARYLVYPDAATRASSETIASGLGPQSSLWPTSISGDFPIFALRLADAADLEIVAKALRMQEYLRARGLMADLVVINEQASSYVQDLQAAIDALCENARSRGREHGPRQHIFAVRRDLMDDKTYRTLIAVARIVLHTRNGSIEDQIERAVLEEQARAAAAARGPVATRTPVKLLSSSSPTRAAAAPEGLEFWNGFGGFADRGRAYVVRSEAGQATPQPWVNIIANAGFGFHASAEGACFTWSRNSRDFQITPWSNDPVVNRPGEGVYIHDLASGETFSPFACLAAADASRHEARHMPGASIFTVRHRGLVAEAAMVVDAHDPVRIARVKISNPGPEPARLRIYAYAEWVMGNSRAKSAPTIVPSWDGEAGALMARNPYGLDFGERVAFTAFGEPAPMFTADRTEFLGRAGSVRLPEAAAGGLPLSGTAESGVDPCAVLASDVEVAPGADAEVLWLLGDAGSLDEARELLRRHRAVPFAGRMEATERQWDDFLGTVQVETPDRSFDAVVNTWLPYQALACRIRARAGFYQASGAFGFRDQLQDTLALLLHDPSLARAQILNAASRQFPEGDVQHWWLPRTGAGVRTMISDDVVWLGYAAAHYVRTTGDSGLLAEELPFIVGDPLIPGQHDAFFTPETSKEKASVYEHCARALDLAVQRTSDRDLPLILGGDWNDGMNRVGEEGRGESVWLGWFLAKAIADFAPLAEQRGDEDRARRWRAHAEKLRAALNGTAWDGDWFLRGTFDDGSPLGSVESDECRIDSLAQSWSVLSGVGEPERARRAMVSARGKLVDDDLGIVKLFTPPFKNTDKEPGYIKSYPPGVRENGGQYTHAATWFIIALAELGMVDEAYECFRMINPVNHALDREAAERYRVEPYVVAADIYSEGQLAGRGGWTWYTGSAGWLYRTAVEGILGITREGNRLRVEPRLPSAWEGFSATLNVAGTVIRLRVERSAELEAPRVEIGGRISDDPSIPLRAGTDVSVLVRIPPAGQAAGQQESKQPSRARR